MSFKEAHTFKTDNEYRQWKFPTMSSAKQLLTILSACPSTDDEDSDTRQKCRKKGEPGLIYARM